MLFSFSSPNPPPPPSPSQINLGAEIRFSFPIPDGLRQKGTNTFLITMNDWDKMWAFTLENYTYKNIYIKKERNKIDKLKNKRQKKKKTKND